MNAGQLPSDAQTVSADTDLTRLHDRIGHYARLFWDLQRTRVATSNRLKAMERDGVPQQFLEPVADALTEIRKAERTAELALEHAVREHPMADWIKAQRGIGLGGFGRLLAVTGPLDRFPTVSKLWKYLGLAVVDGKSQRMPKGELASHTNCAGGTHLRTCKPGCKRDHHPNCSPDGFGTAYAPQGKVVCHQIAESIVKVGQGGPYRAEYDRVKAYYAFAWPDATQKHRHNAAMRKAVKDLVRDMWIEWRRHVRDTPISSAPLDSTNSEQAA